MARASGGCGTDVMGTTSTQSVEAVSVLTVSTEVHYGDTVSIHMASQGSVQPALILRV